MTYTTQDLLVVSEALSNAVVNGRFMSAEHAKAVFIKFLRDTGLDTPRDVKPIIKVEKVEVK